MFKRQIKNLLITFLTLISFGMSAFAADDFVRFEDLYEIEGVYYKKFTSEPFNGVAQFYYNKLYFYYGKERISSNEYYQNGKLIMKEEFCKNGRLIYKRKLKGGLFKGEDGKYVNYHCNGKIEAQWTKLGGKIVGDFLQYYPNGQLKRRTPYSNGEVNGVVEWYEEDGSLIDKTTYVDGERNGPYLTFYRNGALKSEVVQREGKNEGYELSFFENGKIKFKDLWKNGKRDGWSFEYDNSGEIIKKRFYDDSRMINPILSTYVVSGFPICQILSSKGQFCKSLNKGVSASYSFSKMDQYKKLYINPKRVLIVNEDWRYIFDIIKTNDKMQIRFTDEALKATYGTIATFDIQFSEEKRNWFLVGSVVDDIRGSEDDRKVIGQYRKYDPPIPFLDTSN